MKHLPIWLQGIFMIPMGLIFFKLSEIVISWNEFFSGVGYTFLFFGWLQFLLAAPAVYYDVLKRLIISNKQRQVTQAITGQSDPFYRSILFVTGLFLIVIGQELLYVVKNLDKSSSDLLGWIVLDITSLLGWGLTILGVAFAGFKLIGWLLKKVQRRSPATHPMQPVRQATPQFQSRHDPFKDIRGYDD